MPFNDPFLPVTLSELLTDINFTSVSTTFQNSTFDLKSILLGLVPSCFLLFIAWLNAALTYNRDNIKELKEITKEFINIWTEMTNSAREISRKGRLLNSNPDWATPETKNTWQQDLYKERVKLDENYNEAIKNIAHLYFYFDGYYMQNKIEEFFEKIRDSDWLALGLAHSEEYSLADVQNEGTLLLFDIKREIDALAMCKPRPIHWIKIRFHFFYLQNWQWIDPIKEKVEGRTAKLKNKISVFFKTRLPH